MPVTEWVVVAVGAAVLLTLLWRKFFSSLASTRESDPVVPPGVTITAQQPMSDQDMYFFNLLCLAVQEEYLVLAQVPLWCLVDVQAAESSARARVLGQMALKRMDFVLVHPGTRAVEAVVQLDQPSTESARQERRDRVVETVLRMAQLKLVKLNVQHSYTVQELSRLLGVKGEA